MVIRANDSNAPSLEGTTSVDRKMNNTQKINLRGGDTIGSDQSLSQTRNLFGNTGTFASDSLLEATLKTPHANQTNISQGLNDTLNNRKASSSGVDKPAQNQLNNSRLFKVNKSKKKLDTARRSRIKELQGTEVPSQQVIMARLTGQVGPQNTAASQGRGIP